jgi:hypothetical protein
MSMARWLGMVMGLLLAATAWGQTNRGVGAGSKYGEVEREIQRPDLPAREQQRRELNEWDRRRAQSLGREYHPGVGRYEQVRGEIRRGELERYIAALRAGDLWAPPPQALIKPLRQPGDVYAADLGAGALGPEGEQLNQAILTAIAHRDGELAEVVARNQTDPEKQAAEQALTRAAFREKLAVILEGYEVTKREATTRP